MINNTIELCKHEKDTCIEALSKVLTQEDMEECNSFMFNIKEERHLRPWPNKSKLERLERKNEDITGGHINNNRYMYRQSGTENVSLTSSITNTELD